MARLPAARGAALALCSLLIPLSLRAQEGVAFADFFVDSTLRIDYYHSGSKDQESIGLDHLYRQGAWAGSTRHLVDHFGLGRYAALMYDTASGKLIFSRTYDTYFGEYRTTAPAREGIARTFHESVLAPFPRRPVRVVFERRDRRNAYHALASVVVDPGDYHIITESPSRGDSVYETFVSGPLHERVDLLIIGEGYTLGERGKFETDLRRYTDIFFSWEPYKRLKEKFNVRGIFSPSPEDGVDEPRQGVYRHTLLGASFNSLDSDRYLLVEDNRLLRDVAAQAPYDALLVMVNSRRYGGGGLYNDYCCFTSDGTWNEHVMLHEFGHAFAGLGDEYYTKDVAYEDFLVKGVEPNEPNITALLDPAKLKWRDLLSPGISIPTEWGEATYDSLGALRDSLSTLRARLAASGGAVHTREDDARVAALDTTLRTVNRRLALFFVDHPLRGKVGAFEGAGYMAKGFYRPTVNSLMNSFNVQERTYYPVNERAIERVIATFTE
ncbi:MAG TPA: M64 family metallopeptidase [Bacteroidota bacterium]|nr:M64 family metallopeptidase [Bacteroidota bacterium]